MKILDLLCPRKNPKIQESCKSKAIRRTGAKGQLKNARRNKKRLGFNLTPPSLCFFGFSNGLSIDCEKVLIGSLGEPIFSHSASHGSWLLLVPRQELCQRYAG